MRDVAVVGAGPAGLHAAYRLAAAGTDVVLLEAQSRIGERAICSGVIGEEAFGRFALPARSVLTRTYCVRAVSPQGRKLEYRSSAPLARVVDKGEFNRDLADVAASAGAQLRLGIVVESIEPERQGVVLRFRSRQGDCGELWARVAVIATGVHGSLNRPPGLAKPGEFLRALQADVALGEDGAAQAVEVYVGRSAAPGAFGWKIPLGGGRARVGLMATVNPRLYFEALLHRVAPHLDPIGLKIRQKPIGQAPAGSSAVDRVLVIGEAAGHVKTSTGGGIYYGLISAELAVEVILRALRNGDFTVRTLGEFERYWFSAFGGELLTGYCARKLAACLSDELIEKTFEWANATDLLLRLNGSLRFDWHQRALLAAIRSWTAPFSGV